MDIKKLISIFFLLFLTSNVFSQEWEANDLSHYGLSIDFINANTGFVSVTTDSNKYRILKTTNKGANFTKIYEVNYTPSGSYANTRGFSFDMITEQLGFVYIERAVYRTTNGGSTWVERCVVANDESYLPMIKFTNENIGFLSYTRNSSFNTSRNKIFKTTNGGSSWDSVFGSATAYSWTPVVKDISVSNSDPNYIIMVGYYRNFNDQGQIRRYTLVSTNGGAGFGVEYDGGAYGTEFSNVQYLPGSSSSYRIIGTEDYGLLDPNTGTYCYTNYNASVKYKISDTASTISGLSFVDANKGYAYIKNKLYKTTNSGVNWSVIYNFDQIPTEMNRNALTAFNDVIYSIDHVGKFVTHKLSTNLYTFFDNQSSSGSLSFDGTSYNTPTQVFLRGGLSTLNAASVLNSGQTNERIFYKWFDNQMYGHEIYFDSPGNTFSNYYKTKQLSTISSAIGNSSQTKSVRDTTINNITTTHTIHESMGGIFYCKSTNHGASYQREEIVNLRESPGSLDGNKNSFLNVIRSSGGSYAMTVTDANRNVAVTWERYNSQNGKVEINLARRVLNTPQTGYEWESYEYNGDKLITSFDAPSSYQSTPKCFVIAGPNDTTNPSQLLSIVPHLKYNTNQNKLVCSVRRGNLSQDYSLDSGDIQNFSVVSPYNYYSSSQLHFTYIKNGNVV